MLVESGAVRFGSFTLTSGQKSDVYVDIKHVWTHPDRLRLIAQRFAQRVRSETILAGMELGAVPLVVATALETGRPYVVIRKQAKAHGTGQRVEGTVEPAARALLLEDVATTGGSLVESVSVLRAAGAQVERALVVVDREAGATEALAREGVRLEPLATLSQLRGVST
jgi:orotate phosphoribosyltransferase